MKTNEFKDWNIKQLQKELNKKLSFLPNNQKKDLLKIFLNIIVGEQEYLNKQDLFIK